MNSRAALPFLTLSGESVAFGNWMIGDPDQPLLPAQELLNDWDYERDLEVAADFSVDLKAAASELRIEPAELAVAAVLKAGTGTGSMPRQVETLAVQRIGEDSGGSISGRIESHRLSGRLQLELSIVLDRVPARPSALSPKWRGSRLWQLRTDILIEDGGDSRFPIELIGFGQAFSGTPQVHAPWYLDWRPGDFHSDFGAAVRVYVNSDIPALAERFAAGDPLTLQAILGDVISQMTGAALEQADTEHLLAECTANSVGHQVRNWMDIAMPGQSLSAMKAMREHAPGRFRAAMLAAADVGDVQ